MKEKIARIVILVMGVCLVHDIAATPGTQMLAALAAGLCIGTTITLILMEE